MCPPCAAGNHAWCYDGDLAREKVEFESFRGESPPWYGCGCEDC